jgi:hypothetical protein
VICIVINLEILAFRKLDEILKSFTAVADLSDALSQPLPFKIPILPSHAQYAERYPNVFEIGSSECEGAILEWMRRDMLARSEISVVAEDHSWEKILKSMIPTLIPLADQNDSSSLLYKRPDITMIHRDAIVLKVKATLEESYLSKAEKELVDKFKGNAYHLFPYPGMVMRLLELLLRLLWQKYFVFLMISTAESISPTSLIIVNTELKEKIIG